MEKIKTCFSAASVYEVKRFNYALNGYLMAEIEIFIYSQDSYGGQARMFVSGQVLTIRETHPTLEQALQSAVKEVERVLCREFDLEEKAS